MSRFESPLSNIRIANPCSADWSAMYGDNRKRFCGDCKLNVYNLSGMSRDEAEALITNSEGRCCVRFYSRADATIITQDCPVGWAAAKQRARATLAAAASLLMALFTGVLFVSLFSKNSGLTVGKLIIPLTMPTPEMTHTMGAVAYRPEQGNVSVGRIAPAATPDAIRKIEKIKLRVIADQRD